MELIKHSQTKPDTSHDPVLKNWGFNSNLCSHCGKDNKDIAGLLLQCGRCKLAYYCSRKCFNDDLPIHRKQCTTGKLNGYAPDPSKAQKLPDPPKPMKYEEPIKKKKREPEKPMKVDPAVVSITESKDIKGMHGNAAALEQFFCSEVLNPNSEAAAKTDQENDRVLAMSYDELTEEDIDDFLVQLPGPIYPCRCAKHRGIHSKYSVATQSWSCPECNAYIAPSDIAAKLSDDGPEVPVRCPECTASFTVPRIQINDATDTHCPRKPSRSLENEYRGRPNRSKSEGDSPPTLPSRCPECDACISWPVVESGSTDGCPRAPVRCPECDAKITVPRIQINDAVDEQAPRRPRQSTESQPPRMPTRCPECDAYIALTKSSGDGKPTLPKKCPECDATITAPRIKINNAVDDRLSCSPRRDDADEGATVYAQTGFQAAFPCPRCQANVTCPMHRTGGCYDAPKQPVRCPECNVMILVPRIQINDAVDERKPKKPARSQEVAPPKLPTRCPECNVHIKWPINESGKGDGAPMKPVRCPECDAVITVPRVQFNDATDEKAPKKPNRFKEDDEFHRSSSTIETENRDRPPRMPMRCKDCRGFLTWSGSELRKASPFENVRSHPRDVTESMLQSHASFQESITISEDDDFVDRLQEGYSPYYEVVLRKLEPIEENPTRSYIPHWTIALRKVDSYRMQHSGTASFDVSHSSATISTVDLRRTEIQKRDIGWEKPEWVTSPPLRKTDVGEVLHSCGKLEKGITEIKNEAKAVPEWATMGPRLRKTASVTPPVQRGNETQKESAN